MVCYVSLVYPRPHFGLLSRWEAVRDEPAQYISMRAPETTAVVPNGSHYRDSQYRKIFSLLKLEGDFKATVDGLAVPATLSRCSAFFGVIIEASRTGLV